MNQHLKLCVLLHVFGFEPLAWCLDPIVFGIIWNHHFEEKYHRQVARGMLWRPYLPCALEKVVSFDLMRWWGGHIFLYNQPHSSATADIIGKSGHDQFIGLATKDRNTRTWLLLWFQQPFPAEIDPSRGVMAANTQILANPFSRLESFFSGLACQVAWELIPKEDTELEIGCW